MRYMNMDFNKRLSGCDYEIHDFFKGVFRSTILAVRRLHEWIYALLDQTGRLRHETYYLFFLVCPPCTPREEV